MRFVCWYNHDHRHSGIRYVSPAQRHAGEDRGLLAGRHELYLRARAANPRRWSGETRDWTPVGAVTLNPEKDTVVQAAIAAKKLSGSIGEPAFPSRPGEPEAVARSEGEERSGATRSHAQREHGEAGEHRTFPEASTMAHSAPAGGPGHRPRGDIQGKEAR